ncbi:MAG TPA: hypothetical protein VG939_10025 [Caulobacteraceae bacterium]|nr:hypothetical protein [Caulobacteraceae bacterium]
MTAILYPVAADPEAALAAPLGRAAREREAGAIAGRRVTFATGDAGPACSSRAEAEAAFARWLEAAPEDRFCRLREVVDGAEGRWPALTPVEPTFEEGRRWPKPGGGRLPTLWRLSVSYWRIPGEAELADQAREIRRKAKAAPPAAAELRALQRQPLRPVRPQQPLDIGLFETRLPEEPDTVIPDE